MKKSMLLIITFIWMFLFTGCVQNYSNLSKSNMQNMSPEVFFKKIGLREDNGLYIAEPTWSAILDKNGARYNDGKIYWKENFLKSCKSYGGNVKGKHTFISQKFNSEFINITGANTFIKNRLDKNIKHWGSIDDICIVNGIPVFGYSIGTKFKDKTRKDNIWWNYKVIASKLDKNEFYRALNSINFGMSKLIMSNKMKKRTNKHLEQEESFKRF